MRTRLRTAKDVEEISVLSEAPRKSDCDGDVKILSKISWLQSRCEFIAFEGIPKGFVLKITRKLRTVPCWTLFVETVDIRWNILDGFQNLRQLDSRCYV